MGLLLLSVAASTSLVKERVHGSLDLLLSTPLPTRSILIGKWRGAFRSVRSVIIWAALIAGVLVTASGRWLTVTPLSPDPPEDWPAAIFCAVALCGIAVILFAATVATFDRCLGRVAKRPDARSPSFRRIRRELTVVRSVTHPLTCE
jgi:ABC-type Na+ efflux pump permease subunit